MQVIHVAYRNGFIDPIPVPPQAFIQINPLPNGDVEVNIGGVKKLIFSPTTVVSITVTDTVTGKVKKSHLLK